MVPLSFAILGLMGLLRGLGTASELLRGSTDKDQKDLS